MDRGGKNRSPRQPGGRLRACLLTHNWCPGGALWGHQHLGIDVQLYRPPIFTYGLLTPFNLTCFQTSRDIGVENLFTRCT